MNNPLFQIRKATKEDFKSVQQLDKELQEHHHDIAKLWTEEQFEHAVEGPYTLFFVAEYEDRLVGFTYLRKKEFPKTSNIMVTLISLYVQPRYRKLGIGKTLFERSYTYAKEQNAYDFSLNVKGGNEQVVSFYEKMGMNVEYIRLTDRKE